MDEVAWGALTLTLTALAGVYTWWAFRNRGIVPGIRGVGLTLLPLALLLTDSLRMVTRIGSAVADWATALAWNPKVWAGLLLAGIALVCFVVAGFLSRRAAGEPSRRKPADPTQLPTGRAARSGPVLDKQPVDDDLAEIEALLRKRGIS